MNPTSARLPDAPARPSTPPSQDAPIGHAQAPRTPPQRPRPNTPVDGAPRRIAGLPRFFRSGSPTRGSQAANGRPPLLTERVLAAGGRLQQATALGNLPARSAEPVRPNGTSLADSFGLARPAPESLARAFGVARPAPTPLDQAVGLERPATSTLARAFGFDVRETPKSAKRPREED